ncbi:hypothetical protein [Streptomyces sp. NPDC057293]
MHNQNRLCEVEDDVPSLFLPFEKHAADGLRKEYGSNAFTCGTLLGGC